MRAESMCLTSNDVSDAYRVDDVRAANPVFARDSLASLELDSFRHDSLATLAYASEGSFSASAPIPPPLPPQFDADA